MLVTPVLYWFQSFLNSAFPKQLTLFPDFIIICEQCLPHSIPKPVVSPGNLGIKDVDETAREVLAALKAKGRPADGGPEYSLRSIRAAVEILKENQDKVILRQSLVDKFKAGADNTSRGYTFYSIGEKIAQAWDKYFPK